MPRPRRDPYQEVRPRLERLQRESTAYSRRVSSVMEGRKLLVASPRTSVAKAAELMAKRGVGAVMVVERKRLVGIFTERDAVFRVMARRRDPQVTRLRDAMTVTPQTVNSNESFGHALLIMHEYGCRHVPVIKNGEPIGIVSSRDAVDPDFVNLTFLWVRESASRPIGLRRAKVCTRRGRSRNTR